jgi:SSS family solute:Na+ symporter
MLGVGLTGLMASFMSGMAGNVTAFNTIFTYDIYQTHIRPGRRTTITSRGRVTTVVGVALSHRYGLPGSILQQHQRPAQLVFSFVNAPCSAPSCWACSGSGPAGTAPLRTPSGTVAAAITHGCTLAEGKGGWITTVYEFPSSMAQNFWIAIMA